MASKPPGVLGTASNPGHLNNRSTFGYGTFHSPGIAGSPASTFADLEHKATALAHRISRAIGWNETQSAAYRLIGRDSFTAGVIVGMGENLAKTVVAAVDLLQTLALAEYWESKQDHSFMARLRSSAFTALSPATSLGMAVAGHFWPGFDLKAQEAYEERGAIADAIAHAFGHPKEFFKSVTKAQEVKAKEFADFLRQKSLSGNFHAGVLMGELLFDLLMVLDLAVGLAKLAMAVPRLARYTEDLARLAREFRVAKQLETKAAETVPAGPRITQAEKDTNAARGRSPTPAPSPANTKPLGDVKGAGAPVTGDGVSPYGGTTYAKRLAQTPISDGSWSGARGESVFTSTKPEVQAILGDQGIRYTNGYPDFSPVAAGEVTIPNMSIDRAANFAQADEALAEQLGGSANDIAEWRFQNKYTWHEVEDLQTMQLVPSVINGKFGHVGGVGEINAGMVIPGE